MKHILPFDEINRFSEELSMTTFPSDDGRMKTRKDKKDVIDEIWDLLILSYLYGNKAVNDEFGLSIEPDYESIGSKINISTDGKTTKDRLSEYIDEGDFENLNTVIETEGHRLYNQGILDTANNAKRSNTDLNLLKRWNTMLDNRVRRTHEFLESVVVPLDEPFATIDGDRAQAPGGFRKAENNVNCRCVIDIISA